jgi:branched-chain amino acid transport system ATP-binding protein
MSVLRCTGLSRSFGALKAVHDVTLGVGAGSRHALIGPNGAGKSTLFKLIAGTLRSDAGTVALDGRDLTGLSEVKRCRIGVSQTLQQASLFASMTAIESVALAIQRHDGSRISIFPRRGRELRAKAHELLVAVGLAERTAVAVPALSHGERKQLELALALACRPRLLLLDEPAAGMPLADRVRLVRLLRTLPPRITLLFVEHDLDLVFALADRVSVLHLGRLLLTGTPDEIRTSGAVQEAYLGTARREELFFRP